MGTLNLTLPDGRSGTVQVGDDFAGLSADKQAATIADIQSQLAPHDSFGADVMGGLHDAGTGIAQGLKVAGGVMARNGMPEWGGTVSGAGDTVAGITPNAPAGSSPSQRLGQAIKAGNYGDIPGLALHSITRGLVGSAPILAAGAAGGPVAAGAMAGATSVGPLAYERAANNGRAEPTTADAVEALPGAAATGVAGALLPGATKLAGAPARALARTGMDAAGMAGMDTAGQLGGTVGTDKGASLDPYQTAAAAVTGAGMGAARSAPGLAKGAIQAGSDQLMSRTLAPPSSPEAAQSVQRVVQQMADAKGAVSTTGKPFSDTDAANMVKSNLRQKILADLSDLQGMGLIDRSDMTQLRSQIIDEAARHNNNATPALFDAISNLPGVPDAARQALAANVMDLNTVSTQSFRNRMVGPLGRVGNMVGQAIGIGGGLAAAVPTHGASLLAVLAHNKAGMIGQAVGAAGDRLLGTDTPTINLQALNAKRMLGQSTSPPVPSLAMALRPQPDPVTGNTPDPIPVNTPIPSGPTLAKAQAASVSTLPPLRIDTPETVHDALAQADAQMAPQALQTPQAMGLPPQPPLASGEPMMAPATHPDSPLWERLTANGNPNLTRAQVRAAASQVYSPAQIAALDAHTGGHDLSVVRPIQAILAGQQPTEGFTAPAGGNQGYAVEHSEQARVNTSVYLAHTLSLVQSLRERGLHAAADAVQDIAANKKTIAAKQAARAALPPEVAAMVPDFIVNHGGK